MLGLALELVKQLYYRRIQMFQDLVREQIMIIHNGSNPIIIWQTSEINLQLYDAIYHHFLGCLKVARGYLLERRHPFLNRILGK